MFEYSQHHPPPDLQPWVRLVWMMRVDGRPTDHTQPNAEGAELVVPDGHAELIYNLGQAFHQQAPGSDRFRAQPSAILNGQLRGSVRLFATGHVQLVGIRLQPWALGALTRQPASLLTDCWYPTGSIASRLLPNLEDALHNAAWDTTIPDLVMQHLREHLQPMTAPSQRVISVVNHVARSASSLDLAAVRRDVGMSERGMQRMFEAEVGLTTMQFAKVVRVQHAVKLRRDDDRVTWARAALDAGYYDQSHFNKDFRAVVGCSPTELMLDPDTFTGSLLAANGE
jgi:AraC-like DNA-binding protein